MKSVTKITCLVVAICIAANSSFARNLDSLRKVLAKLNSVKERTFSDDTNKVNILYYLSIDKSSNDPDTALIMAGEALRIAEKRNWAWGVMYASHAVAICHYYKSDYYKAAPFYLSEIKTIEKMETLPEYKNRIKLILSQKSRALGNLGILYREQGDYTKALKVYFEALKIAEELGDKQGIAAKLGHIGVLYEHQNDYKRALENYLNALKVYEETGAKKGMAVTLGNIGTFYLKAREYERSLEYYKRSLKINMELNNKRDIGTNYSNLGALYTEMKKYNEAEEYFKKSIAITEESGNKEGYSTELHGLGALYLEEGKVAEAEKYLLLSLRLSRQLSVVYNIKNNYSNLSELYAKTKRPELAYRYYDSLFVLKDSLQNEEITKQQVRAEMNFEFEKKEALAAAENEKRQLIAISEKKRKNTIIWSAGGILLLVLGFAVFSYLSFLQKRKINVEITKQKDVIEQKQKEIVDSIHYGLKIQRALITSESYIQKNIERLSPDV